MGKEFLDPIDGKGVRKPLNVIWERQREVEMFLGNRDDPSTFITDQMSMNRWKISEIRSHELTNGPFVKLSTFIVLIVFEKRIHSDEQYQTSSFFPVDWNDWRKKFCFDWKYLRPLNQRNQFDCYKEARMYFVSNTYHSLLL